MIGKSFISHLLKQFKQDKCTSVAAELTVTSLLAIVPLTALIFALLSLIPDFQDHALKLQQILFQYFVPTTGESVQNHLTEFVDKTKSMSLVGFIMLVVTALLMMRTIDISFNNIWKIKRDKTLIQTFLVYWAVLTLGPLLLGSSLLITSYLQTLPLISNVVEDNSRWLTLGLPFVTEVLTFSLMYFVIPNRKIAIKHAFYAALLATLLFEIAKTGFAIFVEYFSTYQVIFGALATIPLFLIWLFLSWNIVLFGAEFCHALVSFGVEKDKKYSHPFILLASILIILSRAQVEGKSVSLEKLLKEIGFSSNDALNQLLEKLIALGLVAQLTDLSYCLILNSDSIEFNHLYQLSDRRLPSKDEVLSSRLPDKLKSDMIELVDKVEAELALNKIMV